METERRRLDYRRHYRTRGAAKSDRSERFIRRTVIQTIVCTALFIAFYTVTWIDAPFCKDLVISVRDTLQYTIDVKETAAMITDKTKSFIEAAVKPSTPATAPSPLPAPSPAPSSTPAQEGQSDVTTD